PPPRWRRRASSRPPARPGRRPARRAEPSARRRADEWARRPSLPRRAGRALAATLGGAALEALDATARVNQLLAPGVEGVAVGADLDVQLGLGRARMELVAARAAHVGVDVLGMYARLHGELSVAARAGRTG